MNDEPGSGEIISQLDDLEKIIGSFAQSSEKNPIRHQALTDGSVGMWQWVPKESSVTIDQILSTILKIDTDTKDSTWSAFVGKKTAKKIETELLQYQKSNLKTPFRSLLNIPPGKDRKSKQMLCTASYDRQKDMFFGLLIDISVPGQDTHNSQFTATIQNIPIGVVTLNSEGNILTVNPAFLKIFGIRSEATLINDPLTTLDPIKQAGIEHHFNALWEHKKEFEFESPEIINYQDERLYLHCRGFALPGAETAYMILFSDITRRKNLEDQFTQSQRLESIGKLAGGVAHDFNNILTVIKGTTSRLLQEIDDENNHYQSIDQIHRAAERAEALTQQLLAFSRRQLLQPKIMDINAFLTGMENSLRVHLGDRIQLKMFLSEDTGKIKADPHQVEQIIKNLVFNAMDAMPDGGVLGVETKNEMMDENYLQRRPLVKPGRYVMVAISDTGKGIEKEIQAHIFEPFFTTKDKGRGTGMGLSTVYGIVKQSNGYIWVYSEPDKGTTVKLYFPFYENVAVQEEIKTSTDQKLRGNETILVVDDEEEVRNLVSEMLRFYGYNVLEAPNGANALQIFEKYNNSIQIVLTDIVMPQMNGMEMVEKIMMKFPDTRVIFMSGYTDNMVDQYTLLDKEKNFLQKPFNALTLVGKIREILDL